jgi:hypothetical protein
LIVSPPFCADQKIFPEALVNPSSTLLLSTGSAPWAPAIKFARNPTGLGELALYFDPRSPRWLRAAIGTDVAILAAAAGERLAELGVTGPRRVDLFFLARARIKSGVRGFRIELSGANGRAELSILRSLLSHELGHVVNGCLELALDRSTPRNGVAMVAALLVDEYMAERLAGALLAPHLVAPESTPGARGELLARLGQRNVEVYTRPLRRAYRPVPGQIRAAYQHEPGPRALVPTMLDIKRLASPIAYATGSAHAFGASPAPLLAALSRLPRDVAASLERLAQLLDTAGNELPERASLAELAAFRATTDPAIERPIADLSAALLARLAGRMRVEEMHPGWLAADA